MDEELQIFYHNNIKQNHLTKNLPNQYRYIFALNLFKTKE